MSEEKFQEIEVKIKVKVYNAKKTMFLRQSLGTAKDGKRTFELSLLNMTVPCVEHDKKFYVFGWEEMVRAIDL